MWRTAWDFVQQEEKEKWGQWGRKRHTDMGRGSHTSLDLQETGPWLGLLPSPFPPPPPPSVLAQMKHHSPLPPPLCRTPLIRLPASRSMLPVPASPWHSWPVVVYQVEKPSLEEVRQKDFERQGREENMAVLFKRSRHKLLVYLHGMWQAAGNRWSQWVSLGKHFVWADHLVSDIFQLP